MSHLMEILPDTASFSIEVWDGEKWNVIGESTTIGYKRIL